MWSLWLPSRGHRGRRAPVRPGLKVKDFNSLPRFATWGAAET